MDIEVETKVPEGAQATDVSSEPASDQVTEANPKKRPRDDDDGDNPEAPQTEASDKPTQEGEDQTAAPDTATPEQPKLSKNQLRKQKRQKLRDERKVERKLLRKETRHAKTERRRLEREEKAEALAQSQGIDKAAALKKIVAEEAAARSRTAQQSLGPVPVAFIIDCDFEKYMRENELVSLAGQVTRSYSMNRTGVYQGHILVSSWGGKLKERFDTVLKSTHQNWKGVTFVEGDFVEAGRQAWTIMTGPGGGKLCPTLGGKTREAKKEAESSQSAEEVPAPVEAEDAAQTASSDPTPATTAAEFSTDSVVYLSADSPNTLDKLEPNTSYVIGGLVDRNREKRLCQTRAEEKGIRTAKLPIGEYMQMASRQVLATNHVVEIMSKWLETGDWGTAFMAVIPKRKGGHLKGEDGRAEQAEGGDDSAVEDDDAVEEEQVEDEEVDEEQAEAEQDTDMQEAVPSDTKA